MIREYTDKILNGELKVGGMLFPPATDREYWDKLAKVKGAKEVISKAEKDLNYQWPLLLATQFMEYERTGNRRAWEIPHFNRRETLTNFVIAECIENEGRFVDDITNGIILTCEETYWGLSAHRHGTFYGIPGTEDPYLDIFASDAGSILATAAYLLKDKLDETVYDRVIKEVRFRMTDAFMKHDDFWWQAIPTYEGEKRVICNWNPWICENLMSVVAIVSPDEGYLRKCLAKIMQVLDIFIDAIPEDGGCDEGVGYWCVMMADALHILKALTYGGIDVFHEPLIRKYSDFFGKMFISEKYVVNFNDCLPICRCEVARAYSYGKEADNPVLCNIAHKVFVGRDHEETKAQFSLTGTILAFSLADEIKNYDTNVEFEDYSYLDRIQILTAWQDRKNATGLFLATKGGHNDESHNHNDIGTVTVYANGTPLLIDPGKGTYTKDNFTGNRYKIWYHTSSWHNLPEINGVMEHEGKDFYAKNAKVQKDETITFDLDLEHAWPSTSGLESYHRNTMFDKNKGEITVTDSFEFINETNEIVENLIFCNLPEIQEHSLIVTTENGTVGKIEWNTDAKVTIEHKDVSDDDTMCNIWENGVWRVRLKFECGKKATFSYKVSIIK